MEELEQPTTRGLANKGSFRNGANADLGNLLKRGYEQRDNMQEDIQKFLMEDSTILQCEGSLQFVKIAGQLAICDERNNNRVSICQEINCTGKPIPMATKCKTCFLWNTPDERVKKKRRNKTRKLGPQDKKTGKLGPQDKDRKNKASKKTANQKQNDEKEQLVRGKKRGYSKSEDRPPKRRRNEKSYESYGESVAHSPDSGGYETDTRLQPVHGLVFDDQIPSSSNYLLKTAFVGADEPEVVTDTSSIDGDVLKDEAFMNPESDSD